MKLTFHWLALCGLGALAGCSSATTPQPEVARSTKAEDAHNTIGGFMSFGGEFGVNRCLDASGGSFTPLERVDSWTCNGTPAQEWQYTLNGELQVVGASYPLCLEVYDNNLQQGLVELNYCTGAGNQVWVQRNGTLVSGLNANYCLDVDAGNTGNNVTVDVAQCNGTAAQIWWPFGSGVTLSSYEKWSNGESECLDVLDNNPNPGSTMDDWPCNNLTNQTFTFSSNHEIKFNGLCLDVLDGDLSLGQVHMQYCNGSGSQMWAFGRGWNGDIVVQSELSYGFGGHYQCLDIYGDENTPGTVVDITTCNGTMAQAWSPFIEVPDP